MIAYRTIFPLVEFLVQICNYIDVLAFVKFLHPNTLWIQALSNTFVFHFPIVVKSLNGYILRSCKHVDYFNNSPWSSLKRSCTHKKTPKNPIQYWVPWIFPTIQGLKMITFAFKTQNQKRCCPPKTLCTYLHGSKLVRIYYTYMVHQHGGSREHDFGAYLGY